MTDNIKSTLALAVQLSPNVAVQTKFTDICNEMVTAKEEDWFIILTLISGIHDGIADGNWPGMKNTETVEEAARRMLKEGLNKLADEQVHFFKKIYAPNVASLSVNEIVDRLPIAQLNQACAQVQNMLGKRLNTL